jgi:hypothetical protein
VQEHGATAKHKAKMELVDIDASKGIAGVNKPAKELKSPSCDLQIPMKTQCSLKSQKPAKYPKKGDVLEVPRKLPARLDSPPRCPTHGDPL